MAVTCAGYRVTAKTGHRKITFYSANLALGSGADTYAPFCQYRGGGFGVQRQTVETVFEDRRDVAIRPRAGRGRAGTRRVGALRAVLLGQPQDPQTGAIALLGMGAALQNGLDLRSGDLQNGVVEMQAGGSARTRRSTTSTLRFTTARFRVFVGRLGSFMIRLKYVAVPID